MSPSSTSSSILLAGGALIVTALGLGYMAYSSEQDEFTPRVTEIDDDEKGDEEEFIAEADVCHVFDKLFLIVQQTLSGIMQQVQQLQMVGQRIPEAQLQGLIRQELERAIVARQAAIIDAAGMDPECFEQAVWEFLEDPEKNVKAKNAVERFQKAWQNATGENVVGWRPGQKPKEVELLSADRTVQVAELYFNGLTDCMRNVIRQYKSDGKDLTNPQVQHELNLDFARSATDAGEAALAQVDVTLDQFQNSVSSHAENPTVGRALAALQQKQQMDLMRLQDE
jgi:hypothetical protein